MTYPTWERSGGDPAGAPSTVTVPPCTIWTPTIARISVDFPHPDGPSRPVISPLGTTTSISWSTSTPPRTTRSACTSMAAWEDTAGMYPAWLGGAGLYRECHESQMTLTAWPSGHLRSHPTTR